jgi:serine/threonine protein kinase
MAPQDLPSRAVSAADSHTSESAALPHFESGAVAKRHLIGEIARGHTSVVYLAAAKRPHGYMVFAVKELRGQLRGDDTAVSAFLDAAHVARSLDHPNLVRTFDVVPDDCLLVMEFVDGQPLERVVRRARKLGPAVPLRMHLRVIIDVLAALEHLHALPGTRDASGQVHLELSPQKVFITYDGRVKLLGPGPKRSDVRKGQSDAASRGSSYLAPECLYGTTVDGRADVFAVGVMLYEAVLWSQPGNAEPPAPGDLLGHARGAGQDADPALLAIARCAMDGDPGARYPTARMMGQALEEYAARSGPVLPDVRDLSSSVRSLFAHERQKQHAVIKARLSALDAGHADGETDELPRMALTPSVPLVSSVRPSAPPSTAPPVVALSVPPAAQPPVPSSGMSYAIAASLATVMAAGGVTWFVASRPHRAPAIESASASTAVATAAAGPAAAVRSELAAAAREPPARVAPSVPAFVAPSPVVVAGPPIAAAPARAAPYAAAHVVTAHVAPKTTPKAPPQPPSAPAAPDPTALAVSPIASTAPRAAAAASADSPIAAPPPKPSRAIHKDNPYLP